jgi:predicted NBD/HSP70 family sugar kinase
MTALGIALGEDRVVGASVDAAGEVRARAAEAVREGDLARAVRAVHAAVAGTASAARVGVATAFHQDGVPSDVAAALADGRPAPAIVTAGQALVLSEQWCGAARDYRDVVAFSIAEHVEAGVLVNGALLAGAHGQAGSVAWLALNPVEREDYRRHGGLEAEVAAAGIVKRLVWRIKSGDRSRVVDQVNGELSRLKADDVFAAARDGDGVCISVVRDTAKYVGMAVANLATVLDPECVVLGGTLARSGDLMFDAIRTECSRRLRPSQADAVRIVLSSLGDDAVAIGAARAAMIQPQ